MINVQVGLVGCGRWGRNILRDLKTIGCDVTVAAKSATSKSNAQAFNADRIVNDIDEFASDLDGYVVASPTTEHLDAVEALLPRDKPIFVEKPLSSDLERARRLPENARKRVFVMHKWRYHPAIGLMRSLVVEQEFGAPLALRSHREQWGQPHQDVDAIWILAPHDLSIAMHLFGALPRPIAAIAPQGNSSALIAELEDQTTGARIVFEISAAKPYSRREIVLTCEHAAIVISDKEYSKVTIFPTPQGSDQADPVYRDAGTEMPLLAELDAFVDHLKGAPPPLSAFDEEIAMLEVLVQLRRFAGIDPR